MQVYTFRVTWSSLVIMRFMSAQCFTSVFLCMLEITKRRSSNRWNVSGSSPKAPSSMCVVLSFRAAAVWLFGGLPCHAVLMADCLLSAAAEWWLLGLELWPPGWSHITCSGACVQLAVAVNCLLQGRYEGDRLRTGHWRDAEQHHVQPPQHPGQG